MKVLFLDLREVNAPHTEELRQAYNRVCAAGHFILGPELLAFEDEFAAYCGSKHCIGVGNGLDALRIILQAHGVGPGSEVLVPSNTFIATWLAVTQCGATPVAVEPDASTHNVSAEAIAAAITPRTAAVIAVHLYGQPADMDAISRVTSRHGLLLIEDAAQAHGAQYNGRRTGSLGDAAATSFYPGKNLGALGDGGAVLTNDATVADRARRLRNYGSQTKYHHEVLGANSRLDELQAAFLRIKLRHLDAANQRRAEIAHKYSTALTGSNLTVPRLIQAVDPVWHLYVVRSRNRDALQIHLTAHGIQTLVHYPIPPHRQGCYLDANYPAQPIAEQLASEVLSLPISPAMSDDQVNYVIAQAMIFNGPQTTDRDHI